MSSRKRSIVIAAPARCGCHWLEHILRDLTGFAKATKLATKGRGGGARPSDVKKWERKRRARQTYTSHVTLGDWQSCTDLVDIVALLRDPRDVLISWAFYVLRPGKDYLAEGYNVVGQTPKEVMRNQSVQANIVSWFRNYAEYEDKVPHALVKYEDLLNQPVVAIRTAFGQLGRKAPSSRTIKAVVEKYDFAYFTHGREPGQENVKHHYRKGIIGDWVNHLAEEEAAQYLAKFGDIVKELGYL